MNVCVNWRVCLLGFYFRFIMLFSYVRIFVTDFMYANELW